MTRPTRWRGAWPQALVAVVGVVISLVVAASAKPWPGCMRFRSTSGRLKSICAPANLKMYYDAHKEHGSLPWSRIVEPAIHWAENK